MTFKNFCVWSENNLYKLIQWFAMTITAYGILNGVTMECYQEPYDWLCLPFITLINYIDKDCISFYELSKNNIDLFSVNQEDYKARKKFDPIYIFALDVSGSIIKTKDKENIDIEIPSWYRRIVDNLKQDDYSIQSIVKNSKTKNKDKMKAISYAKLLLIKMLVDINNKNDNHINHFAFWSIGENAKRVFPDPEESNISELNGKEYAPINKNYINALIKRIDNIDKQFSQHTDFKELFNDIYKDYIKKNQISDGEKLYHIRPLIITIMSDCIHDVSLKDDIDGRKDRIEKNWNELKKSIQSISNADVSVNLILISPKDKVGEVLIDEKQVFSILDATFEKFFIFYQTIHDKYDKSFLYPKKMIVNPDYTVNFYYESSLFISNRFEIHFLKETEIEIQIPPEWNGLPQENIVIEYKLLASNGNVPRKKGRISKAQNFKWKIKKSQRLQLLYLGKPLNNEVYVRLIDHTAQNVYYTQIKFIKTIPLPIATIMTFLLIIISVSFVLLLLGFISIALHFKNENDDTSEKYKLLENVTTEYSESKEVKNL